MPGPCGSRARNTSYVTEMSCISGLRSDRDILSSGEELMLILLALAATLSAHADNDKPKLCGQLTPATLAWDEQYAKKQAPATKVDVVRNSFLSWFSPAERQSILDYVEVKGGAEERFATTLAAFRSRVETLKKTSTE